MSALKKGGADFEITNSDYGFLLSRLSTSETVIAERFLYGKRRKFGLSEYCYNNNKKITDNKNVVSQNDYIILTHGKNYRELKGIGVQIFKDIDLKLLTLLIGWFTIGSSGS